MLNSDFKSDEVEKAKKRALTLKRSDIVCQRRSKKVTADKRTLTFVINRNDFMVREIKNILRNCQTDINELLGETEIIVAERKNGNIASTVFAKSSFSREQKYMKTDQKCNGKGCKTCKIMNLEKNFYCVE